MSVFHRYISELKNLLFSSQGTHQSLIVIIGTLFSTGFSALALIIISRLLGPSEFGEFSVGLAISLMLNRIADMGLSYSIQRYASKSTNVDEQNRIYSYTTRIKLIAIVIIAILGVISYRWLSNLLHFNNPEIVLVSFLLSSCTVLYEQLQAILQSLHRFKQIVFINITQSSSKLIGSLLFFVSGLSTATSLLSLYLFTPLLPVLAFFMWVPRSVKLHLNTTFGKEQSLMSSMAKHSAVMFISAGIVENVDVLFVQTYVSTFDAGLFSGISKISLLLMVIAYSLGNVLNPRVARYTEAAHLNAFIKKAWLVVLACIVGYSVSVLLGQHVLLYTLGSEYMSGTSILNILLASSFITIATMPFIAVFFSIDSPWYFSLVGIVQLVTTLLGNIFLVPELGITGAAWTRLITKAVAFIITVLLAKKMISKKYAQA